MEKPILDPCCGSRMFYFDKNNPLVDFRDNRVVHETLCDGRVLDVEPDTIGDVTHIDADDGAYHLVIFDPPHLDVGNGWQVEKYGKLPQDWQRFMKNAFAECWRVLAVNGTLVFKWYEYHIPLSELRKYFPCEPVIGNRKPTNSKTHWLLFYKPELNSGASDSAHTEQKENRE